VRYGLADGAGVTSLCPHGHHSLALAREEWAKVRAEIAGAG